MGLARELQLQVNFTSRGARGLHRDLAVLTRDLRGLERRPGQRSMELSYGAEQAASQIHRVTNGIRRGLQATAGLAADFEDQMGRVAAISTQGMTEGQAAKAVATLSKTARTLGETTRYTAREAAGGMYELAQAGYDVEKQVKTMPAVLSLATVGQLEIAQAAEITANIMGGFQIEAGRSVEVVDRLAAAVTSGNLTMQDMGIAMAYAAPQAKQFNQEIESMAGWMAVLGDAGIKGSKAGTGVRSVLLSLGASAAGATKEDQKKQAIFKKYGVELEDEKGNLRDATAILGELGLAMARSGESNVTTSGEIKQIFGKQFGTTASVLMSSSAKGLGAMDTDLASLSAVMGTEVTEEQRKAIWEGASLQSRIGKVRESDGLAGKMAAQMEKTAKGQWREFESALEETGIVLGEQVLPLLTEGMRELKPIVINLAGFAKRHPEFVKGLAKFMLAIVAVGAVVVPILHTFSALAGIAGLGGRVAGRLGMGPAGSLAMVGGGLAGGGVGVAAGGSRARGPASPYSNARGFGVSGGVMGWNAGGGSPDGVWASPEAEVAQRRREREANRRARRVGFGRRSKGYAKYQAQQAALRQQERAEAKRQRQQDRANRRAARRASGLGNAGVVNSLAAATMGFALGQAVGHGINAGMKSVFGKTATQFIDGWLEDFNKTDVGGRVQGWLKKQYGVESDPEAENIAITSKRGGAKSLTELHGETEESKAKLAALEKERQLAKDLGVSYETVRRAREQGFSEKHMRDKGWMSTFVFNEQLKDADFARDEAAKKKRNMLAAEKGGEAWALAKQAGKSDEEAYRASEQAAREVRDPDEQRRMKAVFAAGDKGGRSSWLFDGIAAAVKHGIVDGAAAAPALQALIPATAVAGADAGG